MRQPRRDEVTPENKWPLMDWLHDLMIIAPVALVAGVAIAGLLHLVNLRGTFAILPALVGVLVVVVGFPVVGVAVASAFAVGGGVRERWRYDAIQHGGDKARKQHDSTGVAVTLRNWHERRKARSGEVAVKGSYPLGHDRRGAVVRLPLGVDHGRHTLLIGATGAGKTTTMLGAVAAQLAAGHGVIAIDPKGDHGLIERLRDQATGAGRRFWCFSLDGYSDRWNPIATGTPSERADKLIGAEEWTEPHYKRLYQRYLLAVFMAIDAGPERRCDLQTVVSLLDPDRLALFAREIEPTEGDRLAGYLTRMAPDEARNLAGLRNRLGILAEGEYRDLFVSDPSGINLVKAITDGAVVVFSLNGSRVPETVKLLGAALFQDLKAAAGVLEVRPQLRRPAAILVDEFGAFAGDHVVGLFQRARSAKLSLTLSTQELADLTAISPALRDQVLGNVETIIAHRQNVPESAELVAELGGTREVWIHTFQTRSIFDTEHRRQLGSKRLGHEFHISPDTIKALHTGEAVVITKNPHRVRRVRVYRRRG